MCYTCVTHCKAQNLNMSTCCGNRHTVTYGCVVITCQTTGGRYCNEACSQTALTFTTVRIPSLVTGSVSILKCSPSSPCMLYLALHAVLYKVSLSVTCSRRGEIPLLCSFTLPEPYCMNPGCRGKRASCRILFIVLYTVWHEYTACAQSLSFHSHANGKLSSSFLALHCKILLKTQ